MATPVLEVYFPDGNRQSFSLTDERVVVGTSAKCQVLIDRPEVSPEHLLLSPRPDGCWVAVAKGVSTPALVDGQVFERGMLPWGRSVLIGPIRLVLTDGTQAARSGGREGGAKEGEKTSPVIIIAALVVVPVCLWMAFQDPPGSESPQRPRAEPPALFDSAPRTCPQTDPALALQAAEESTRIALSKVERMPFHTQDGIDAVNDYNQSAACYRLTGDTASAQAATQQADAIRARLEDAYQAHRFNLDRALEQNRNEDALVEVRLLAALVAHRPGPYLTALNTLERLLNLRIDQAAAAAH